MMQGKIADMYTRLQSSRALLYGVARQQDNGVSINKDAAACFLYSSLNATKSASQLMKCF
jgi:isovaleryl-CoA dehydrogenase